MTDKQLTREQWSQRIANSARSVYTAEAKGSREAAKARAQHAALLAQFEALFGTGVRAPSGSPSTAFPSGIPWCAERCDADGRLLPGR